MKENCPDIRNSKILDMVSELKNWNIRLILVDPWADPEEVQNSFNLSLTSLDNLSEVDSIIVSVGHNEFRELKPKKLKALCKGPNPIIADVKSIYDKESLIEEGFSVFRL